MNTEYKYDVPFNVHLDNVKRQHAQKVRKQNQAEKKESKTEEKTEETK